MSSRSPRRSIAPTNAQLERGAVFFTPGNRSILPMTAEPEVLIVGAGLAGLACGKRLAECGVPFQILEAGEAVGGVALLVLEGLADLAGGQVGVAAGGLHLWVGLGGWLDNAVDVSSQLGVFDLAGSLAGDHTRRYFRSCKRNGDTVL